VKNSFICYAFESHINVGWGPHPVLGPPVGQPCAINFIFVDLAKKAGDPDPIVAEFNPGNFYARLECSQHVDANPPPSTFTWTYNGVVTTELSNELTLILPTNDVIETAECTAENGLCKN